MTRTIVLDTDFLSAFLKIGRLALIKEFYEVDALVVPSAVFRELSRTPHLTELAGLSWIRVLVPDSSRNLDFGEDHARLGAGEKEAILLASERESLLLTNDTLARQVARRKGLDVVDIPTFLLSCKLSGFLDRDAIQEVVQDLRERDHYGFRKEILDRLLS